LFEIFRERRGISDNDPCSQNKREQNGNKNLITVKKNVTPLFFQNSGE